MSKQALSFDERVNRAIATYLDAIDRGHQPDREKFLTENTDIRRELAAFLDDLGQMQDLLGTTARVAWATRSQSAIRILEAQGENVTHNISHLKQSSTFEQTALLDDSVDSSASKAEITKFDWPQGNPDVGECRTAMLGSTCDSRLDASVDTELRSGSPAKSPMVDATLITSNIDSDSNETRTQENFPIPDRLGRYTVESWIGSGAMGDVYRAYDPHLDRIVAVKVPKIDRRTANHGNFVERFLREARTAAAVRHPHICPIYDAGKDQETPFVVMAFVSGETLAERLKRKGRFEDPREAVALVLDVAEALEEVHQHGIIHRDLKPGNILVDQSGKPLLTDFGLARSFSIDEHLTADGGLVGTPAYMAPEQVLGERKNVGPASDLYGLGMVLYEMLTGTLPFKGGAVKMIVNKATNSAIVSPASFRPDLDPTLVSVVERTIQFDPDMRFPTAAAFATALREWLDSQSARSSGLKDSATELIESATQMVEQVQPVARSSRRWLVTAAICLLVLPVLGFVIARQKSAQLPAIDRPSLSGNLKLRFIGRQLGSNKSIARQPTEGDATPLFNGQKVQLQVSLNHPGHVYVIWIDSDGTAQPIYPWDFGHSTLRGLSPKELWNAPLVSGSENPTDFIRCPQRDDKGFSATGKPGMQHVILLARTEPLESLDILQQAFSDLPASPLVEGTQAARYFDWSPGTGDRRGQIRGLEPGVEEEIGDAVELEPSNESDKLDMPMFAIVKSRLKQQEFELIKVWRFAQRDEP